MSPPRQAAKHSDRVAMGSKSNASEVKIQFSSPTELAVVTTVLGSHLGFFLGARILGGILVVGF